MSQDTRATPGIRLSPAVRVLLADLKKLSGSEDAALLEQAVTHYYRHLLGKKALRDRLKAHSESSAPASSEESREVLSWLSDAFASEPVPLEGAKPTAAPLESHALDSLNLDSLSLNSLSLASLQALVLDAPSKSPDILTDAQGWALPEKPRLESRRAALSLTLGQLALESGLSEETLEGLEKGALLWLSLQEQWALAAALDWSLEQLQQALEKSLL